VELKLGHSLRRLLARLDLEAGTGADDPSWSSSRRRSPRMRMRRRLSWRPGAAADGAGPELVRQ
jgi:hypothetical protein